MPDEKIILVTGAAGFIGRRLIEILHQNRMAHVRAGILDESEEKSLVHLPIEIVRCDVLDKTQISKAAVDVDYLVHCAYGSRKVTVQGTENILSIAHEYGVERFIYLSSTEVYGHVEGYIDETYPFQYMGNEYGDSKIEAEKICWDFSKRGLALNVIRPTIVYGPFGRTWTLELALKLKSGFLGGVKGNDDGICNLLYVDDLVSAILLATFKGNIIGEAFNINGPDVITWNQYFSMYADALGIQEPNLTSPGNAQFRGKIRDFVKMFAKPAYKFVTNRIGRSLEKISPLGTSLQRIESKIKSIPSSEELRLYNRKARYITKKAEKMLSYKPLVKIDRGLEISIRWLSDSMSLN